MARGAYVQFDETTSDLSDNAFRVLCYLRHHVVRSDVVYPSIESMADDLKRSIRTCKYAIAELKTIGLIDTERDQKGQWSYRIVGAKTCTDRVQKSAPKRVQNSAPVSATHGATHGATHSATHGAEICTPPKNPHIREATEATETTEATEGCGGGVTEESKPVTKAIAAADECLEPFESGLPVRMPEIRNGVKPSRTSAFRIVPTQFQQATIDRIYQVLGTDGDDFAAMVSQDQADAGFVEWVLRKAESGKKPIALAVKLLKTSWRDGWTNPNAEEDAQYAELVEIMRSIQQ